MKPRHRRHCSTSVVHDAPAAGWPEQRVSSPRLFQTFIMAGYECAAQRRGDGQRVDLQASTGHLRWAARDFAQLRASGIGCARDGLRWHVIERQPGQYDWSSFLPLLRVARECNLQVVWDFSHYGYPDGLDIWRPAFVERFARFAGAAARLMVDEGIDVPFCSPINEISFWSWAGGDVGYFNPGAMGVGWNSSISWCALASRQSMPSASRRHEHGSYNAIRSSMCCPTPSAQRTTRGPKTCAWRSFRLGTCWLADNGRGWAVARTT